PIAFWLAVGTPTPCAVDGSHSTAFRIAVSSATLFVARPRYSNPSCIFPFGDTSTTPEPAGPGLPEHAPSVYAIHPSGECTGGAAERLVVVEGDAPAGTQASSGRTLAPLASTRLATAARYARPSFGLYRISTRPPSAAIAPSSLARASTRCPRRVASIHGIGGRVSYHGWPLRRCPAARAD